MSGSGTNPTHSRNTPEGVVAGSDILLQIDRIDRYIHIRESLGLFAIRVSRSERSDVGNNLTWLLGKTAVGAKKNQTHGKMIIKYRILKTPYRAIDLRISGGTILIHYTSAFLLEKNA